MENRLHALLRNRPDIRDGWSQDEVVLRWWRLFPQRRDRQGRPAEMTGQERQAFLADPEWIAERRRRLGHIDRDQAAGTKRRHHWQPPLPPLACIP